VAAGPAVPSLPLSRTPRQAPTTKPTLPARPAPLQAAQAIPTAYVKPIEHTEPTIVLKESKLGVVYLLQRMIAWTVDSSIHLTLGALTLALSLESQGIALDAVLRSDAWIAAALFLVGFNWALILAQEVAFGTSLGKRLCRLEIEGSPAALFVRAFFFIPSQLLFGLGLVWALFDSEKRCWHDRVADARPLPTKRY